MREESLFDRVKKSIAKSKGNWQKVAAGSKVGYFTVVRIGAGKTKFPRFNTVEKLARYFEKRAA